MSKLRAVLLDVFETVLAVNFGAVLDGLAQASGVPRGEWKLAFNDHRTGLLAGAVSLEELFSKVLHDAEVVYPSVRRLVELDSALLLRHARLYPDVLPFLDAVRSRAVDVALVSNCSKGTGALLDALGLRARVRTEVLSCDVGILTPDAGIYLAAAARLGVSTQDAVFVDDQPAFCAGAEAVGMSAVLIDRGGRRTGAVSSLLEVLASLDGLQPRLR